MPSKNSKKLEMHFLVEYDDGNYGVIAAVETREFENANFDGSSSEDFVDEVVSFFGLDWTATIKDASGNYQKPNMSDILLHMYWYIVCTYPPTVMMYVVDESQSGDTRGSSITGEILFYGEY